MVDIAFIRLYKNDFTSAKRGDDSPAVSLDKNSYIQQLLDQTFVQYTNIKGGIAFAGGIRVDLVDACGELQLNIDDNFYYDGYVQDGVNQIRFEFGRIFKDFYNKSLFLKITDLVNSDVWYSNGFLVTNSNSHLQSFFAYKDNKRFRGVGYDLKSGYQSIGFKDFYYDDDANKRNGGEYTTTDGSLIALRQTTTFLKRYIFNKLDSAISNRLNELFSHPIIYLDGKQVVFNDFKPEKRQGDTNFKPAEILLNPKDGELDLGYQVFVPFGLVSFVPSNRHVVASFPNDITFSFNKPSILGVGTLKIFDNSNNIIFDIVYIV